MSWKELHPRWKWAIRGLAIPIGIAILATILIGSAMLGFWGSSEGVGWGIIGIFGLAIMMIFPPIFLPFLQEIIVGMVKGDAGPIKIIILALLFWFILGFIIGYILEKFRKKDSVEVKEESEKTIIGCPLKKGRFATKGVMAGVLFYFFTLILDLYLYSNFTEEILGKIVHPLFNKSIFLDFVISFFTLPLILFPFLGGIIGLIVYLIKKKKFQASQI